MLPSLLLYIFNIKPPLPLDDLTPGQAYAYVSGTIFTIIFVPFILKWLVFNPLHANLEKIKNGTDWVNLRNEMDYADYLQWAAENSEQPKIKKKAPTVNTAPND